MGLILEMYIISFKNVQIFLNMNCIFRNIVCENIFIFGKEIVFRDVQ